MVVRLGIRHLLLAAGVLLVLLVATVLLSTKALPAYSLGRFRFQGPPSMVLDASQPWEPMLKRADPDFRVYTMSSTSHDLLADGRTVHVLTASGDALLLRTHMMAPGHGGIDYYVYVYYPSLCEGLYVYYRSNGEDHDASIADRFRAWQADAWTDQIVKTLHY